MEHSPADFALEQERAQRAKEADAFAKEARQRAIDVLCRHTYAEREREMLLDFREAVRRIAAKPIDSSDMMDEIEHLLSLLP